MYTIYTSPGCGPCMTVKAHLRAHKIPHTLVDVSQNPAAVEKLRKMGYSSAPVTVDEATGEHWHGYLPDRYASPAPEAGKPASGASAENAPLSGPRYNFRMSRSCLGSMGLVI